MFAEFYNTRQTVCIFIMNKDRSSLFHSNWSRYRCKIHLYRGEGEVRERYNAHIGNAVQYSLNLFKNIEYTGT